MERLVCWTLMGLRTDQGFDVWYQLGTYPTADQAQEASNASSLADRGIVQTRVMPYYRVEHEDSVQSDQIVAQKPIATETQPARAPATAL